MIQKNNQNSEFQQRLISQKEAGKYLGISYWTVRDMVFRGDIPHIRIGRRVLIDIKDLEEFIQRSKFKQGA